MSAKTYPAWTYEAARTMEGLRREIMGLRESLCQIKAACDDNAGASCDKGMALKFVGQVATAAINRHRAS